MSLSRFQPEASTAGRQAQEPDQAAAGDKPQPETPLWEKLAGLLGLLLVLGVLGFLLYEGVCPRSEAAIVAAQDAIIPQESGYLVTFTASNRGRQTAASVLVEGALYDPASPEEPVETSEMTFDYIPEQSDRSGALLFEHDPRQYELRIQAKGFMDP
jgi:uncharacterized protein (TIGR02588 family)